MENGFFRVDAAKCIRCRKCVADCAFRALKFDVAHSEVIMPNPERCMRCQHCFAICPVGAISIDGKNAALSEKCRALSLPGGQEVDNWMRVRRSTRQFQKKDVPQEEIDKILRVLGNAPTGCNARGLTFHCVNGFEKMDLFKRRFLETIAAHRDGEHLLPRDIAVPAIKLREGKEDIFFRGAAGMVVISSDISNPLVATPEVDVSAACAYFEMIAQAHGIATCWFGFMRMVQAHVPEILEKTLGINCKAPFYAMLYGYSAVQYERTIQRDDYAAIKYW